MHTPLNYRSVCRRGKASLSLMAAVAAALACQQTRAGVLTWDADLLTPGAQDGFGTWDNLNLTNWSDGITNVQWNSSNPDSAVFGSLSGVADIVTLSTNLAVDDLTFSPATSGNYTIDGAGNTLTLVDTTITATAGATLNVNLAGTTGLAVTSTNGSTIRLSGANSYSGPTSVVGATLALDSVGALGNSTQIAVGSSGGPLSSLLINVPDFVSTTMGAGTTATIFSSGVNNFGAIRGADFENNTWAGNVVLGAGGSTRLSGGNNGTLTVTGVISGTGTGLTTPVIFSRNTNATTVLSAVNTYTNDTQLFNSSPGTAATLKIGIDNAINPASSLSVLSNEATAPEVVDLNGHVLTFRTLDTSNTTSAASSANLMVLNNGATPSALTVGDPINNTGTFGGSLQDGASALSLTKNGVNRQILVGANTYTGMTTVNNGTLQLGAATPTAPAKVHFTGSNGVLASTNFALNGGAFVVDNFGNLNNNNNRLPDTADLTFGGGTFEYRGSDQAATNSSETVRNLTLAGGISKISVRFDAVPLTTPPTTPGTNSTILNANQITRNAGGGIALVNGTNLGKDGTSTTSVARFLVANAPTLVGTTAAQPSGINAGAKNTQIVPFLLGEATVATGGLGTDLGTPNTFLTYGATTGFRPLNPTDEFQNNNIVAGANTRITAATTASTTAAVNSLIVTGPSITLTIANGQTLTNTSGAILFVGSTTTGTISGGGTLDFGNVEAVITANSTMTGIIGSKITGTNGLTFNGPGTLGLGSTTSTYSGNTTIRSGTLVPQATSQGAPGAVTSGPLGTGTLVLAGGGMRGPTGANVTVGNSVLFQADTNIPAGIDNKALTLSGPVTLAGGTRRITNSTTGTTSTTTFSGSIGDGGLNYGLTIAGNGANPVVLSGANTYTGPTTVLSSTLIVSGSLAGTSATIVGNSASPVTAATLGGSGTLGSVSASTIGATIDPGNTANVAGIMKTGAFSLANGAHLSLQIGGITAGGEAATGYDQLIASGAVTLTGGDLKLSLLGTPTLTFGDQLFVVVNNSSSGVTGTFATVNGASFDPSNIVIGGQQFQLAYNGNFAGPGSDGMANDTVLVAVPEPSTCLALASALGLLGCVRRRRRG